MFAHAFRSLSFPSGLELNYSASVLSFPLFHRFCLAACFLGFSVPLSLPCFSPYSRPGFPCLLSGSKYSAFCSFPFVLPCFAPTAVPQVLPFWFSPRGSTLGFRSLSFPSALASHYSAFCSSFLTPPLASQLVIRVRPFPLSVLRLSSDRLAWFPVHFFRLFILGFLFVSFRPSLLRSHSCSTGAHLFPSFDFPEVFSLRSPFFRPVPV